MARDRLEGVRVDREGLRKAWSERYRLLPLADAVTEARGNVATLAGRMRDVGRKRALVYRGYDAAGLARVLGMALGVHQQLLWGLTSAPGGVTLRGGGGV